MTITLVESLGLKPKPIQNVTPKRKTTQQLTDQLLTLLFKGHITFTEAANQIGITRQRAYRLWNRWKQTEEAQQIDNEWWNLYLTVKDQNPEKALECLTRLKYRLTTEKVEVKENVKVEEKHVTIIADYTNAISAAVNRDIQSLRAKQQMDTPESQTPPT